jgi:alanine dehydrogenase
MLVGVPWEIKDNEYRVGIVPSTVRELADKGHQVVFFTLAFAFIKAMDVIMQEPADKRLINTSEHLAVGGARLSSKTSAFGTKRTFHD